MIGCKWKSDRENDKSYIEVSKNLPIPNIIDETDAIVKVTMSSICSSDLHIMRNKVPRAKPGITLGHEFVGVVTKVGSQVHKLQVGDRVAANCITFCGKCYFCKNGYINNCQYGGWELGCRIDGCQAEYVRVPFAETGLSLIPTGVTDESALFTGDILSSGYFGAELAEIKADDTVVVVGCGPVGLCTMACAKLFKPKTIIGIDLNKEKLKFAAEHGLIDTGILNLNCGNESESCSAVSSYLVNEKPLYVCSSNNQIAATVKTLCPPERNGADAVIEVAGSKGSFELAWKVARPNASVAVVAMYEEPQVLPLNEMYGKNLKFKTGGVDAVHCDKLLSLIEQKQIAVDFLITHKVKLADIMEGYKIFEDSAVSSCIKCAITPNI